jgi:small subunit ribosomal protein S5
LFTVPKHGQTITHEVLGRFGAARVLLRPASPGTGVIAGGGVRAVLELGGIRDVLAKSLGTTNPINMLKAAESALRNLRRPEDVAKARGKSISEVLPYKAPEPEPEPELEAAGVEA